MRQVMATYEVTLSTTLNRAYLTEQNIYGASRLGIRRKYTAIYENGTVAYTIPDVQQNTLGNIDYEITNYLGNVNVVISDRKIWNTSAFKAVSRNYTDCFPCACPPFWRSMEISSRTSVGTYRYGYTGKEDDNEISGNGNSYDFGNRQYDPRIGRWLSLDPLKAIYPSMSPYCYAGNTPIAAKDPDGRLIIFVNGYRYGQKRGTSDDLPAGREYWSEEFIYGASKYFCDKNFMFVDGTGSGLTSSAQTRQEAGKIYAMVVSEYLRIAVESLGPDEKIQIVTHSMGAAFSEGMIEEFMKNPELAKRIELVAHFSAADADEIKLSNIEEIERVQLNYTHDNTLALKDPGSISTGGYRIPGVKRFGVVKSDIKFLHNKYYRAVQKRNENEMERISEDEFGTGEVPYIKTTDNYNFHYDSKGKEFTWRFLINMDKNNKIGGNTFFMKSSAAREMEYPNCDSNKESSPIFKPK
ncbi:MAG: hypothetical protein FGM14_16035 [Flavobacteriales bacterium]|nr:hypothetical protein [Flavobacteriales bacterium]